MGTELDDLSKKIKDKVDELVKEVKGLDMDKEAVKLLKDTEDGLDALSGSVERKRGEMEEKGLEHTVRKDAAKVLDSVNKALNDIKKDLDPDDK